MSARSLSSSTYDELLRRLLGGQLRPGQVFNRRQVAADLGVSVAPLLEALVLLECEGLIVTTPRKGTRVRAINERDIHGLQIVREALECQAARLACGQPVEKQAGKLRRLAEELDALATQPAVDVRAVVRFHHTIVALTAVPALIDAYERIMKLHLLHTVHAPPAPRPPGKSFVELVEALQTEDPDKAEAAMRKHLQAESGPSHKADKRAPAPGPPPTWLGES
jgi:DNA-binding GntR family transcriptional regulator